MDLKNAAILVTGGASGIGLETARLLRSQGAKVAICGRNSERLEQAAASLGAFPICADVSVEADVKRMVQTVIAEFGDYNALVNNAGYGYFAPLIEQDPDQFNRLFLTNVAGAMLVARESARYFISRQRGNIINISSTAGSRGFAGGTAYAASRCRRRNRAPHLLLTSDIWRLISIRTEERPSGLPSLLDAREYNSPVMPRSPAAAER